jgi:hypothetical protein
MFLDECPPGCRFEIALERCSTNSIRKRDICLQTPWSPFRGVKNSSCIMISQSFMQVVRQACIESVLVTLALQNVDVEELCHVLSLACRVVARSVAVARLNMSAFAEATARQSSLSSTTRAKTGGKGIRTPDFQLAKLALYQLSYAPVLRIVECRLAIGDCKEQSAGLCHK